VASLLGYLVIFPLNISWRAEDDCLTQAWIFILEGLATVVAGAFSFFIIQDFPDTAKFLTEAERAFVIRRLQEDDQYSAAGEKLKWKWVLDSLKDWKTWIGSECCVPPECDMFKCLLSTVMVYCGA
jgi:hypothetical protein